MSSISLCSAPVNSTESEKADNRSDFKHDFMELIASLQTGTHRAAVAAFAAIKQEFQKAPSITEQRKGSTKRISQKASQNRG